MAFSLTISLDDDFLYELMTVRRRKGPGEDELEFDDKEVVSRGRI